MVEILDNPAHKGLSGAQADQRMGGGLLSM
jgi:hypothetical protein